MKRYLALFLLSMLLALPAYGADTKITGLTEDTSPTGDDLIPTVNDPGGTPANRKVTLTNLFTEMLKAPPAIGGTTPAAGSFSSVAIGTILSSTPVAFSDQDATPSILSGTVFKTANTVATTITGFDFGAGSATDGKVFIVIVNDALTTFDFTSSNLMGASSDYLAANGDLLVCTYTTSDSKSHCTMWPKAFAAYQKIIELDSDTLSDTSSPHDLTANEVSGTSINNYAGTPGAQVYNLPAAAAGYNFILEVGLAQNVTLNPSGTEVIYLQTPDHALAALAAGENVVNTSPAVGASITCKTFKITGPAYAWKCVSDDDNFNEETP